MELRAVAVATIALCMLAPVYPAMKAVTSLDRRGDYAMSEARGATIAKPKTAKGRLIEVRGLDKTFYDADREIRVLRHLDLNVEAGEEIAVVGQSGTGKSTLLHIIGSLEEPTAGKVFFEGEDLFALDQKSLAEFRNLKLGFVFQFHYLLADFTALEM